MSPGRRGTWRGKSRRMISAQRMGFASMVSGILVHRKGREDLPAFFSQHGRVSMESSKMICEDRRNIVTG